MVAIAGAPSMRRDNCTLRRTAAAQKPAHLFAGAAARIYAAHPPSRPALRRTKTRRSSRSERRRVRPLMRVQFSILRRRAAPAGQIIRLLALRELERLFHRGGEIVLDGLALDAVAEEIRPQELGKRRRVLGKAASAAQLAGERAIGIVDQF